MALDGTGAKHVLYRMVSLCTGTLPHLSRHIRFPSKPALIQNIEEARWTPYTDDGKAYLRCWQAGGTDYLVRNTIRSTL